jgi:hypothetical protein
VSQIFLSYGDEDRPRTLVLVEALRSQGWSIWWDRTIPPGETWDTVIEHALDAASCVVVLWSATSVSSYWVKLEAREALRRGILVPALLDDVSIPLEFRAIQAARLVGWKGDQKDLEFEKLVRALEGKIRKPAGRIEPHEETVQPPPPPPPRRTALLAASALVGLLAVGIYLWFLHQPRQIVIGVMDFHRRGNVPEWVSEYTRRTLNTILSNVADVHVYSSEAIDFLCTKKNLSEIEAAKQLGVTKMVLGHISEADRRLMLAVDLVDIGSNGMLDPTIPPLRGTEDQVAEMVNRAAMTIVKSLKHGVSDKELQELVANHSAEDLDSYRLLADSMGIAVDEKRTPPPAPSPKPALPDTSSLGWPASAWAADPSEPQIRQLIERYRAALESKNLDDIGQLYVDMTPGMRDALTRYFSTADELKIKFSEPEILVAGDDAVATFTRNDDFKDSRSGRAMHLEVRISLVAKQQSGWKIQGLRKPS